MQLVFDQSLLTDPERGDVGKLTGGGTYPVDWGSRDMAIVCKPSCITGRLGALLYLSIIC